MSTSASESPYHHGELREALVAAALARLDSHGMEGLALRVLAREVGVSPAAPYRHFADRKALLEAVATVGFTRFADALAVTRDETGPALQLEAMAATYVRFALHQPQLFRLMFSAELHPYRDPALRAVADKAYAGLAVVAAREDPEAAAEAAMSCWALAHGLSMLLIDEQILGVDPHNATPLVTALTRRFVAGLRASRKADAAEIASAPVSG